MFDGIEYVRILILSISVKVGILLLSFLNAIKIECSKEAIKYSLPLMENQSREDGKLIPKQTVVIQIL